MKTDQFGTSTQSIKQQMGFQKSSERQGCHNCKNSDDVISMPDTDYERTYLRCKRGEFATTKTAICAQWELK